MVKEAAPTPTPMGFDGKPLQSGFYTESPTPTPTEAPSSTGDAEHLVLTATPTVEPAHVIMTDTPTPLFGVDGQTLKFGFPQGEIPGFDSDQPKGLEHAYVIMQPEQTYAVGAQVDLVIPGLSPEDPVSKGWIVTDIAEEVTVFMLPASHPGNTSGRDMFVSLPSIKEQPAK